MSDTFDNATQEEDDAKVVGIPQKDLKALRERGRRADEAEARATAAERELAFAKARIDPSVPGYTYFLKGYDGELTPEAIKQAAIEANLIKDEAGEGATPEELAAMDRMNAASTGASTTPISKEAERDARLRDATSTKEFDAIYAEYGGALAQ